jgi:hypothetical protein
MADEPITSLTPLVGPLALVDLFEIVDKSDTEHGANGSSRRATGEQIVDLVFANRLSAITFQMDAFGLTLTTGKKTGVLVPYDGVIVGAYLLAPNESGSLVVDVRTLAYASFPGSAASICASAKPTLSAAQKAGDTTLTGWTTTFAAGTWFEPWVESVTDITKAELLLVIRKS